MAPVAQGVDVAHIEAIFQALADVGQASGDFASDKGFATAWAFVVEQDSVAGIDAIRLAVIDADPIRVHLGYGIGAAGVERCGFFLGSFLHQAIQFAGTGLVEAGFLFQAQDANGFEQAQGANGVHVGSVFWGFKRHGHMAHGTQVINFVWLRFLNDANQVAGVAQVAIVQFEVGVFNVRVLVDVVNSLGVERAGAAFDAVDDVTFFKQKFCKV